MNEKFKQPVLYVGTIDDVDLSKPPATGEEYIKRVMQVYFLFELALKLTTIRRFS